MHIQARMKPQIVYFLLLPEVLMIDLAGYTDAFLFANRISKKQLFDIRYLSATQSHDFLGMPLAISMKLYPSN